MKQMKMRCPTASVVGSGFLHDCELVYRGSKTGSYATIKKKMGSFVPVGVWEIERLDERYLDMYEGFPRFYQKHTTKVYMNDNSEIVGMVYVMRPDAKPGYPSERYIDTIYRGYQDFGLNFLYLKESLELNIKEMHRGNY